MRISRSFLLLTIAVASLCACSSTRDFLREKYTGDRIGERVTGPRRVPELNPGAVASVPPPGARQAAAQPSPYDQYDTRGNSAVGIVNDSSPELARRMAARAAEEEVRKPFRGLTVSANIPPPPPQVPVLPPSPAPQLQPATTPSALLYDVAPNDENQVMVPLPGERSDAAPVSVIAQLQPAAGGEPAAAPAAVVEPAPAPAAPIQFAQLAPAAAPAPAAADKDATLHLSGVPKVPERLREVKKEQKAGQAEMQKEYEAAMEEKKKLEEEPSELKPATLPQVEGMLEEIKGAIEGDVPIVQAAR